MRARRHCHPVEVGRSAFAGYRFPPEVILLAVRWYLRFGLSYRDVEELLAERGIEVDHATLFRWVQRFTPLFVEAARPVPAHPGDRWFVDETYVKVAGGGATCTGRSTSSARSSTCWCRRRDKTAARRFFTRALAGATAPAEVTTDRAPAYPRVIEDLLPGACTSPCSTRTTGSRPTTAGSRPGCGPCAG